MQQPEWYLSGETFETNLNEGIFFIKDAGPLYGPIKEFSIKRDKTGEIILETTSEGSQLPRDAGYPPGTIYTSAESVEFVSPTGAEAVARCVIPVSVVANLSVRDRTGTVRQTSRVHEVEISAQHNVNGSYLVEWLGNFDKSIYFPHNINLNQKVEQQLEFKSVHDSISIDIIVSQHGSVSKCLHMNIQGISLFICTFKTQKGDSQSRNGFILYHEVPDDESRLRIREALSFCFGRYLVFLGYSIFDADWALVRIKAVSAYSIDGRVYNLPTYLPSSVANPSNFFIDEDRARVFVQALVDSYERLDFLHLSWGYWHAMTVTPHIAGVHFGALIEALQRKYLDLNPGEVQSTVMEKAKWNKIKAALTDILPSLDLEQTEENLIINKISQLNQIPHGMILQRVFESLNLNLSEADIKAWKERNAAAHGTKTDPSGYHDQIRNFKRLRLIFIRLLLAVSMAADVYVDDCTLGHPIRNIAASVP